MALCYRIIYAHFSVIMLRACARDQVEGLRDQGLEESAVADLGHGEVLVAQSDRDGRTLGAGRRGTSGLREPLGKGTRQQAQLPVEGIAPEIARPLPPPHPDVRNLHVPRDGGRAGRRGTSGGLVAPQEDPQVSASGDPLVGVAREVLRRLGLPDEGQEVDAPQTGTDHFLIEAAVAARWASRHQRGGDSRQLTKF